MSHIPIILASSSPARLELLNQIKVFPDQILHPDIDESPMRGELPHKLAARLAHQKAMTIANQVERAVIIAADTISVAGRTILPKASSEAEVKLCLQRLSQRRHRVYTSVCIIKKFDDTLEKRQRTIQTIVQLKKLTNKDIDFYCSLGEGLNKAGGFSIRGYAECFVSFISGSHSNIVGLPLFETRNMLTSLGA
jgi:septum formation protein